MDVRGKVQVKFFSCQKGKIMVGLNLNEQSFSLGLPPFSLSERKALALRG